MWITGVYSLHIGDTFPTDYGLNTNKFGVGSSNLILVFGWKREFIILMKSERVFYSLSRFFVCKHAQALSHCRSLRSFWSINFHPDVEIFRFWLLNVNFSLLLQICRLSLSWFALCSSRCRGKFPWLYYSWQSGPCSCSSMMTSVASFSLSRATKHGLH